MRLPEDIVAEERHVIFEMKEFVKGKTGFSKSFSRTGPEPHDHVQKLTSMPDIWRICVAMELLGVTAQRAAAIVFAWTSPKNRNTKEERAMFELFRDTIVQRGQVHAIQDDATNESFFVNCISGKWAWDRDTLLKKTKSPMEGDGAREKKKEGRPGARILRQQLHSSKMPVCRKVQVSA